MPHGPRDDYPELNAIFLDLDKLSEQGSFPSLEALNALLAQRTTLLNATPQAALHGLSPDQAHRLFSSTWLGDGPLQLDATVEDAAWAGSVLVAGALGVLRAIDAMGTLRLNKSGTVSLKALRHCAVALTVATSRWRKASEDPDPSVMLEWADDIIEMLSVGGLLDNVPGKLFPSDAGHAVLAAPALGVLAVRLVDACIRIIAVREETPFDDVVVGLRQPAMLMRALHDAAGKQLTVGELVRRSWLLPFGEARALDDETLLAAVIVIMPQYVWPLGELGLVDVLNDEKVKDPTKWRVQPTALFRRVVRLQWSEQEAPDIRPEKRRRRR
ncbi:MAG: hypothetical protein AAB224_01265 [Gemmatimonadota bacterium]